MIEVDVDPLYTPAEIAECLKVRVDHVYDLIKAGRMRALNIGVGKKPTYRVRRSDYVAFVSAPEPQEAPERAPAPVAPAKKRGRPSKGLAFCPTGAHGRPTFVELAKQRR